MPLVIDQYQIESTGLVMHRRQTCDHVQANEDYRSAPPCPILELWLEDSARYLRQAVGTS